MKRYYRLALIAIVLWECGSSCTNHSATTAITASAIIDSLVPVYSHAFRVNYYKDFKLLTVFSLKDHKALATYLLVSKGAVVPAGFEDATKVFYPATHVACMSTTHIGAMKLLNARRLIVATTNTNLIYDSTINAMIAAGTIKDAGKDYQPDYEVIAQSKPDLLFSDGENTGSSQMFAKMKALHVNMVCSRDYFEQEPLARAEWIKFFGAFIGKEKLADSIFEAVRTDYQAQLRQIGEIGEKPTVFCNLPYSGVWYMPCGENYVAKLITDAGGNFLWNKEKPMNGLNLTLNFEQVYERAGNADIWINMNSYTDLKQVANIDAKFKLFEAFKTGKVYNGVNRISTGGGMDIWETGSFVPNIVLRDLASIFHSHDPIATKLYYYRQLK